MWTSVRPHVLSRWHLSTRSAVRLVNTAPPPAREYRPAKPAQRPKPTPPPIEELVSAPKPSLLSRILPKREPKPLREGPEDLERGFEASRRVVTEGVLDKRYKNAAKVYTRLIVALPLAIYLSYELYRRRFLGVEKKAIPEKKVNVEQKEVEVDIKALG